MPSLTITAAGTPQSLAGVVSPAWPTISVQGITSSIGGAMRFGQVVLNNPVGQTGNIYYGSKGLNKTTGAGVDGTLAPGDTVTLGNGSTSIVLDQVWVDTDTSGNKLEFSAK